MRPTRLRQSDSLATRSPIRHAKERRAHGRNINDLLTIGLHRTSGSNRLMPGDFSAVENVQMSLAEYTSRPYPVFARLAVVLRNIPVAQFVIAKLAVVWTKNRRRDEEVGETSIGKFIGETPDAPGNAIDQHVAILTPTGNLAIAATMSPPQSESREELIRRRWTETGSKMWNPNVQGTGLAALNIQGRAGFLPLMSGETLPRYDKLEFKLVGDLLIVCEGVFVDPPKRRK